MNVRSTTFLEFIIHVCAYYKATYLKRHRVTLRTRCGDFLQPLYNAAEKFVAKSFSQLEDTISFSLFTRFFQTLPSAPIMMRRTVTLYLPIISIFWKGLVISPVFTSRSAGRATLVFYSLFTMIRSYYLAWNGRSVWVSKPK